MDALEYCTAKAAPRGSSLHYALLFSPREAREGLIALHAWRAEVLETVDECSDSGVARIKLDFWREELNRAFAGEARHPAGRALQAAITRHGLQREGFDDLLEGAAMDVEYDAYPDFRALTVYCHRVGGSVTRLAAAICGATAPADLRLAHDLGMAFPLTAQLRRLRPHLEAGRVYLPEDELDAHGLDREALLAGSHPEAAAALLQEHAERTRAFYDSAFARLDGAQRRRLLPITVLARLYQALLDEMFRAGLPLLERRVHLTPVRKLWLAWRTARRERRAPQPRTET